MSELDQLEFLPGEKPKSKRGRLSPGSWALLAAVLLSAVLLGLQLSRQHRVRPTSGAAPDFQLKLFDGSEFRLSDYRGQVVLINFWASWCPPCRDEAPDLQALYNDFRASGFVVVGVNMLESSVEKALGFINEFDISYPNGEDTGQYITNLYRVEGPPESFLIDRQGQVRHFYIGSLRYDDVSSRVEALLAEGA